MVQENLSILSAPVPQPCCIENGWAVETTDGEEYYYHAFGEFQPDLNYRNPEVVEASTLRVGGWGKWGVREGVSELVQWVQC